MKQLIFYDNASTTCVSDDILQTYCRYQTHQYFNPSAPYSASLSVKLEFQQAKKLLERTLGAMGGKITFVSSGTEGNNLSLFGTKKTKNSKILISSAEHPAVYQAAMELKQRGYFVDLVQVDPCGRVMFEDFVKKMTVDTDLISIMHVCNETGGVNDIQKLVRFAKSVNPNAIFHSDGVQAIGKTAVNIGKLEVDLYTFSGHKIYAPKGIAGLFVKNGVRLHPMLFGGGQEEGLRPSTENVGGAICLALAVESALQNFEKTNETILQINLRLKEILERLDPEICFLSDNNCVPNILTFASKTVRGEVLLHALESKGIMIGTGSACSSQKSGRRVPEALGLGKEYLDGMIRLSFGKYNSENECEYFEKHIKQEYLTLKKYTRG